MAKMMMDGSTAGISGKVKAGSVAAVVVGGLTTWLTALITPDLLRHGVSQTAIDGAQPLLVAVITGALVFIAGYLARHTPPGVRSEAEELLADIMDQPGHYLVPAGEEPTTTESVAVTAPAPAPPPEIVVAVPTGATPPDKVAFNPATGVVYPVPPTTTEEFTTPAG